MLEWMKKLFREERRPRKKNKAAMVEVLRDIYNIDEDKPEHEEAPAGVDTDIYHLEPREKPVPHRSSRRKKKYKPLK